MLKIVSNLLLVILAAVPSAAGWEMSEFMILTGWPDLNVPEMAPALAKADFNTVMGTLDKLEVCRKHDLKLLIMHAVPETASSLTNDSSVWGYDILDEPEPDKFPELAEQVKAFRRADPNHPVYINLMARSGDYLSSFIDTVKPEVLSYDFYQWWYGPYNEWWDGDRGYFARLEQHRDAAMSAGIPLMCWVEVTANPNDERYKSGKTDVPCPEDNEQKIRQSVFTSLAYGVKGIEWFVNRMMFKAGTSELNECGMDVAAINAELKRLGPILVRLTSVNVYHTPPVPRGTREAPPQHWVQAEGKDLVMGMFKDNMNNDFIITTNRNHTHEQKVALRFLRQIEKVEIFDRQTGKWVSIIVKELGDLRETPYDKGKLESFLGFPPRDKERLMKLRNLNGYLPPYRGVEFMLAPGDGELLRIK